MWEKTKPERKTVFIGGKKGLDLKNRTGRAVGRSWNLGCASGAQRFEKRNTPKTVGTRPERSEGYKKTKGGGKRFKGGAAVGGGGGASEILKRVTAITLAIRENQPGEGGGYPSA